MPLKKNPSIAKFGESFGPARLRACDCETYPSHEPEMARLNRASGQLEGAKKMISERRYCPDILAQLKGARAAIRAVESNILRRHLESCVADSFSDRRAAAAKIAEIKQLLDKSV